MSSSLIPNDGNLNRYVNEWLESQSVAYKAIRPRVCVGEQGYQQIDAAAFNARRGLCLINVWWHPTIPVREAESNRLFRDFDGHRVLTPDPAQGLIRFASTLETMSQLPGLASGDFQKIILLPYVSTDSDFLLAKQLWAQFPVHVVAPQLKQCLPTTDDFTKQELAERFFAWLNRDIQEYLRSTKTTELLEEIRQQAREWLSSKSRTKYAAKQLEARYLQIRKDPLQVAVIGTFSSGKTSFLNAVTKPRLFPVKDIPTTATRVTINYAPKFKAEVTYHDRAHIDALVADLEKLRKYQTTDPLGFSQTQLNPDDPCIGKTDEISDWEQLSNLIIDNNRAPYIKDILVGIPIDALKGITLIDLPGTDSHIPWHKEVTRQAVREMDVVIYLFPATKPFSEKDKELMDMISINKSFGGSGQVLFVLNKIDSVNKRERPSVFARIEGELEQHYSIFRPTLISACYILSTIPCLESADESEKIYWNKLRTKIRKSLDLPQLTTPEEHDRYSGLYETGDFLERSMIEKEVWKTLSWLTAVKQELTSAVQDLESESKMLGRTLEEITAILETISNERKQLKNRYKIESDGYKEIARRKIEGALVYGDLQTQWQRVIDRHHHGDSISTKETLRDVTRNWLTERYSVVKEILETLQSELMKTQQDLYKSLANKATQRARKQFPNTQQEIVIDGVQGLDELVRAIEIAEEETNKHIQVVGMAELFLESPKIRLKDIFDKANDVLHAKDKQSVVEIMDKMGNFFGAVWNRITDWWKNSRLNPSKPTQAQKTARERSELENSFDHAQAEKIVVPLRNNAEFALREICRKSSELFSESLEKSESMIREALDTKKQSPDHIAKRQKEIEDQILCGGQAIIKMCDHAIEGF